jgi:hypothetical protein
MAFFSGGFRKRLRQSAESFILFLVLLAFSIALSFVSDWMVKTNRPAWLVDGVQVLEIAAFIADAVAFLGFCFSLLWGEIKELWRRK